MQLIDHIEHRLALPGDDETLRKRKVAAFFAGLMGVITALLFTVLYFIGDAPLLAWLFLLTFVWTSITLAILWLRPRAYYWAVLVTALYVTIHPWVVVVASGGYRSGLLPMLWALIGPGVAVVLIGIRPALFNAALYVVLAAVAALLDPWAAAHAPQLPEWIRLTIGLISAVIPGMMVVLISLFLFRQVERARMQADALLRNILPSPVADRLKIDPTSIAESFNEVTVLFADIVGFTRMSAAADAREVVGLLNAIFSDFDGLADKHGLEKIKTIGDAYMVVGGLPEPRPDHLEAVVAFAFDALEVMKKYRAWNGEAIGLRIGINTGPIVAGVIGRRKFIYDLWGDTVNTASRMESFGLENVIQVTKTVRDKLDGRYTFEERGPFEVKGKGMMTTYLLNK
ncbi:putative Adenylate cyclase [Candidatus Promineifilum breve]|uniref:Adenylate cyclase n=1 Tax=Candidatus Promineifilum breve TaxID=1806508 RepID=A0A160SY68_9CHLR|nr:adenylate/guanylate cyclase domain-containing protein [Candidatus Promineifilum breve]CUS02381.2 putative Adenylate cyclase [Candidatus Promineifilum breve]